MIHYARWARLPLLVAGTILLTACAETEWVRPGMTAEARARDVSDCRHQVSFQASRNEPSRSVVGLTSGSESDRRAAEHLRQSEENRRSQRERTLVADCMEQRGYQLVEVDR